jgi:probable HAF family extracellular repeat protein
MKAKLFGAVAFCLLSIDITCSASAETYNFTALPGLNGWGATIAYGINDAGQVVGYSQNSNGINQAVIWKGTTPTAIGPALSPPAGEFTQASAINNFGQVVGNIGTQPTIWNGTIPTSLGTPPGTAYSIPYAINNFGQVVGTSVQTPGSSYYATIWNGTTPTVLSTPAGYVSNGQGINDAGQVVGNIGNSNQAQAAIWTGTTLTLLDNLPLGSNALALAINDAGQVVGLASDSTGVDEPVIWSGTTPTVLGTLGYGGFANAINDTGQIVGEAFTPYTGTPYSNVRAVIWDGTTAIDLNTLINGGSAGWTLYQAFSINILGQIVGVGTNPSGLSEAFLLTPAAQTPLPAALPLFATGLGVLGLFGWRRKRTASGTLAVI